MTSHANRGRNLETTILASQSLIVVEQMKSGSRTLRDGRVIRQKGPVDFVGTVKHTGRSIWFDAKQCADPRRFRIGDHLPEHQRQLLIRHGQAGAIAGLLVEATGLGHFFWLNWRLLSDLPMASVEWSMLAPMGDNKHTIDFRRVIDFAR